MVIQYLKAYPLPPLSRNTGGRTADDRLRERVTQECSRWLADLGISATTTLERCSESLTVVTFRDVSSNRSLLTLAQQRWHPSSPRSSERYFKVWASRDLLRRSVAPAMLKESLMLLLKSTIKRGGKGYGLYFATAFPMPWLECPKKSGWVESWRLVPCSGRTLPVVTTSTTTVRKQGSTSWSISSATLRRATDAGC